MQGLAFEAIPGSWCGGRAWDGIVGGVSEVAQMHTNRMDKVSEQSVCIPKAV